MNILLVRKVLAYLILIGSLLLPIKTTASSEYIQLFHIREELPQDTRDLIIFVRGLSLVKAHGLKVSVVNSHTIHVGTSQPKKHVVLRYGNLWELIDLFIIFDFNDQIVTVIGNGKYARGLRVPTNQSAYRAFTPEHQREFNDFVRQLTSQLN